MTLITLHTLDIPQSMVTAALFGEGLQWGGLAVCYLLGQARQFEAFDYMSYVLKLYDIDQKAERVS